MTVTVPTPVADSKPEESIVAEPPARGATDQVTVLLAAFDGNTAALICRVLPLTTVVAEPAPVTVMLSTRIVDRQSVTTS